MRTRTEAYTTMETPIGEILLAGDSTRLTRIDFGQSARPEPEWRRTSSPFRDSIRQLRAYFAGELRDFDLPLAFDGTEFQVKVWKTLGRIPYGKTISYAELAKRIGQPKAMRAVGNANGKNPLPIVIPCHRVVASGGGLGGYGGGLTIKRKLLALEGGWGQTPTNAHSRRTT